MFETGIDLVEVSRIESAITRHGDHFLSKIFHPVEIMYCNNKVRKYEHYAVRFAAKEATRKILLSHLSFNPAWTETYVDNDENGKPHLRFSQKILGKCKIMNTSVSLSHTDSLATAIILLELGGEK